MPRRIFAIALIGIFLSACSSGVKKGGGDAAAKKNVEDALVAARTQLQTHNYADYGIVTVEGMSKSLPKLKFQSFPSTSASIISMKSSTKAGVIFAAKSNSGICFDIQESGGTDQWGTGSCDASHTETVNWNGDYEIGWVAAEKNPKTKASIVAVGEDRDAQANLNTAESSAVSLYTDEEDWSSVTVAKLSNFDGGRTYQASASTKPGEISVHATAANGLVLATKSASGKCFVIKEVKAGNPNQQYGVGSCDASDVSSVTFDSDSASTASGWRTY